MTDSTEGQEPIIPVPPVESERRRSSAGQDDARAELESLGRGRDEEDLRKEAANNEHKRTQRFKDVFETISILALKVLSVGLLFAVAIWFWHIIAPCDLRWIPPDRLDKLQDVVTGGLLITLIADHFRKRMS